MASLQGTTVNGQLNVNHSTPTSVLRLYSGGSTVWSLGVGDASGTNFNITADFGSILINKSTGAISGLGAVTASSFSGSGSGLTGTASSLSIGGTANGLNSSNYISRVGSSGNYNTDFQNTPAGTVRHLGDDSTATNNPGGTWWFVDNYRHSNSSNYWGTQVAWGWEDNANKLATRNISNNSFGSWVYYLNSGNYSNYAIARGGDTVDGITLFRSNKGATSTVGSSNTYALQAFSSDAGAAGMSFHRGGYYAVNMGLDPDNVFRIGGWSASANRLQLDMSGNLTVAGSMYASVFYDSDDNSYYANPAATSNFNELILAGVGTSAYGLLKYGGTRSGDWQSFTNITGQINVIQVENIGGGGHTNYPTGVYTYGGVMSWRLANHSFQLYAAHTGDLAYKTQWGNDNYSGWRRILDSSTYPYAANMNQYVRTTDSPTFADLSITGAYQIRNASPTIVLRDTDHRTGYIHVNSNIFYVLTGAADSGNGSWGTVANGRWPMELNLSNNNATFGADVNAISFTGSGSGLTGTAPSLTAGAVTNGVYTTGNQSIAGDKTFTGITTFNNASDYQISLNGASTTWAGIEWKDSNGTDYIWFNGQNKTFAIGGGGSNISGKKLHVDGAVTIGADYDSTAVISNSLTLQGPLQMGNYKVYAFSDLSAAAAQARTYEIARIGIDYNDWNSIGTFEVEIHEKYWSRGLKKVYHIWYGYVSNSGIRLVEHRGAGDNNFQCRISGETTVAGDQRYISVFVDVRNYVIVDVVVKTNRNYTTNTNPEIGFTYINLAPTPTNIADFTADSDLEISTLTTAKLGGNTILTSATTSAPSLSIGGNAATATNVAWTGITQATRTNYDLIFQPPASSYAGFSFKTSAGGEAGYFLVRGTSDTDVYTAEGITLVADAGWLTLAQRTTAGKGVRIMTGTTAVERFTVLANGNIGIGTSLPSSRFYVVSNTGEGRNVQLTGATGLGSLFQQNNIVTTLSRPAITLRNTQAGDTSSIDRGIGIQFDLGYGGDATSNAGTRVSSGFITLAQEANADWTTASNRNAYMVFGTISSGTVAERMRISSGGNVTITGTISASNFSGTSTGTNTGDQTNISGNAATATNVAWSGITSKPTTLSGFGITDAMYQYDPNGFVQGDINGSGNMQRLWGPDSVQNLLAFRPPTTIEYTTDNVNWTATTISNDVFDNKLFGKWSGFNIGAGANVGNWTKVRLTWVNFGYHFFSHFNMCHSTNGHSMNFVFYKSDLNGVFSSEAFRVNGINSWPGYTFAAHNNVSGWWDTRDVRMVFEVVRNNDYPNNYITVGSIQLMGGYSSFTRLYDWDGNRNITMAGTVTAAGFTGPGTGLTGTAAGLSIGGNAATASSVAATNITGTVAISSGGTGAATTTANAFFVGPNGSSGAPSFRVMATADIPASIVTFAKIQDVAGPTLIGRVSATSGPVAALGSANARTAIGATTVGSNLITLADPGAIRFIRINADNTISALSDVDFRTAIGAGTGGVTVTSGDTTANWFPVVWHSGNALYSSTGVQIYANGGYVQANYFNSSDDVNAGNITNIVAKFGDNYHRSATAAKVAAFITGQSMNISGTATNVTGTVAVANGGTGATSFTAGRVLLGNGTTDITTSANLSYNTGTNRLGVGTTTPGYTLDVGGACHASSFPTSSDIRFKKNIQPLTNALQTILSLRGVKYEWNNFIHSERPGYELNTPVIGMIAQEVENVIPEIVGKWVLNENFQDARSLEYQRIIPYLIEAVKELENKNKLLEARILALENK